MSDTIIAAFSFIIITKLLKTTKKTKKKTKTLDVKKCISRESQNQCWTLGLEISTDLISDLGQFSNFCKISHSDF